MADIAARLDIARSDTYELINTLRLYRFIEQDSDGGMMLGAKLAMLGELRVRYRSAAAGRRGSSYPARPIR